MLDDNFGYPLLLDIKGIVEDNSLLRIEMYELWSSGEKLNFTSEELTVQYLPHTRAERYLRIPAVKSVAGADLTIILSTAKSIYREIEQELKKESISKREEWLASIFSTAC